MGWGVGRTRAGGRESGSGVCGISVGDGACTPWEKGESAAKAGGHENGASLEGNGEAPGKSVALLFCSDVLGCDYVDAGATDICENNVSNVYWCWHIYNL